MKHSFTLRTVSMTLAIVLIVTLLIAACGASSAPTPATAATGATGATAGVTFAKDILPMLQKNCSSCHGGSNPRGGQSLSSYAGLMKGAANGVTVIAGQPDTSIIYSLVKSGAMPQTGPKLSGGDVQKLYDWIKAGAANN